MKLSAALVLTVLTFHLTGASAACMVHEEIHSDSSTYTVMNRDTLFYGEVTIKPGLDTAYSYSTVLNICIAEANGEVRAPTFTLGVGQDAFDLKYNQLAGTPGGMVPVIDPMTGKTVAPVSAQIESDRLQSLGITPVFNIDGSVTINSRYGQTLEAVPAAAAAIFTAASDPGISEPKAKGATVQTSAKTVTAQPYPIDPNSEDDSRNYGLYLGMTNDGVPFKAVTGLYGDQYGKHGKSTNDVFTSIGKKRADSMDALQVATASGSQFATLKTKLAAQQIALNLMTADMLKKQKTVLTNTLQVYSRTVCQGPDYSYSVIACMGLGFGFTMNCPNGNCM